MRSARVRDSSDSFCNFASAGSSPRTGALDSGRHKIQHQIGSIMSVRYIPGCPLLRRGLGLGETSSPHFAEVPSRNHVQVSWSPGDLVKARVNTSSLSSFTETPVAVMQMTPYRHDSGGFLLSAPLTASRAMITSGLVPLAVKPHRIPWATPCLGAEYSCS